MANATREEVRTQVILALERRGIDVRHLEILPVGRDGDWRIGPAMLPRPSSDPAIESAIDELLLELRALYRLEPRDLAGRRVLVQNAREPMKILVAEDNVLIADLIAEALAVEGCVVVGPVGTVEDGCNIASHTKISGALLDIDLQGEMSFPIAYQLRDKGIPFAFVTAYSEIVIPELLRGVPRFSKPFTPWELASAAVEAFKTS
jgi:CheY-like chemotaxis protein